VTLADRIVPKQAAKVIAKHGMLADLHSVRANLTATAIKITPTVEERVFIQSTKTEELMSVAYLAALDAAFVAAELPEPRPGDILTITSAERAVTLGEGTGAIRTGEAVAMYKLAWRG
jgi:hypothetical protein